MTVRRGVWPSMGCQAQPHKAVQGSVNDSEAAVPACPSLFRPSGWGTNGIWPLHSDTLGSNPDLTSYLLCAPEK